MKQILVAVCVLVLFSCSKNGGDTEKPVLVLNTPTGNQTFPGGTVVTISGMASDNDELHEVHIYVINKNSDTEILHFHEHADEKKYNFNQTFTAQAGITYKIEVQADDHVGNTTDIQIEVRGI